MLTLSRVISFVAALVIFAYSAFVHHADPYEFVIAVNKVTGEAITEIGGGFRFTAPWVLVSKIDIRPMRVCVYNAGRSYHCKLVRFVPEQFSELLALEGFRYYWWDNRLSFNSGYPEEYRGVHDLLRGYAFGNKSYPFIEILQHTVQPW